MGIPGLPGGGGGGTIGDVIMGGILIDLLRGGRGEARRSRAAGAVAFRSPADSGPEASAGSAGADAGEAEDGSDAESLRR